MNQFRRLYKSIKTAILSACFLCVLLVPAIVAGAQDNPRVIFENTRETADHLYVTKTVETADERYPAPADAEFTFTLKLDGSLVSNLTYRVFDQSGTEILQYDDGTVVPYTTDRYGTFTLKAGQTALFEHVGTGKSYEVTELAADGFEQIVPAGGAAAVGTTVPEGVSVLFTNRYIPVTTGAQLTSIIVNKELAFPDGYEVPESPEFTFLIKLNNKPYALEDYTITDTLTGQTKGSGTTDADGRFTLRAGETATFEGIEAGIDYEITEESAAGWWTIGAATHTGATQAPLTMVSYTNAFASFGVTKSLLDGSTPDVDFTFQLTGSMNYAIAGAKYYLYSTDGSRVDDVVYETSSTGTFTLKPGQTAIFFGIEPGTVYNVREEADSGYIQRVPSAADGYTGKEVGNSVEILPFINEADETKALTVTKLVESESGDMPPDEDVFTFQLLKQEADGSYSPVANETYSIEVGSRVRTYTTDSEGKFTLKQNETARFETLSPNVTYQIIEVAADMPDGYKIDDADAAQEGMLTDRLDFTFINVYKTRLIDLHIHKRDDSGERLAGAFFDLYADAELTDLIEADLKTDNEGNLIVEELEPGTYYLVETKAPSGYRLLTNPIKIELLRDGEGLYLVVDGTAYRSTDSSVSIYLEQGSGLSDAAHITVVNYRGFGLPLSGGAGILLRILLALAGITVVSVIFIKRRSKALPG